MREIGLTQGKVALVSEEDFVYINQWNWCASRSGGTWYARRNDHSGGEIGYQKVYMHRVVLSRMLGRELEANLIEQVDHINGRGWDNQRLNLRLASNSQNHMNTVLNRDSFTGKQGVSFRKDRNYYVARIIVNKLQISLGRFSTVEEAHQAYLDARLKYFGEFAELRVGVA